MTRRVLFVITTQRLSVTAGIMNYYYLSRKYNLNTAITMVPSNAKITDSNMNQYGIYENDIIIPLQLPAMKACCEITNCFVDKYENIEFLNDKYTSGQMVDSLQIIPNIPTFYPESSLDKNKLNNFFSLNENKNEKYLIKHRYDKGSKQIYILNKKECIKKLDRINHIDFIIQPYYEMDYIMAIDCMCYNGVIHSFLINRAPLFFTKNDYFIKNKMKEYNHKIIKNNDDNKFYKRVLEYSAPIVKAANYNGILEIEWLCKESTNQIFYLEINPRISLCSVLFDEKLKYNPYTDTIFLKYIELAEKEFFNETVTQVDKINTNIPDDIYKTNYLIVLVIFLILLLLVSVIVYLILNSYKKK